MISRRRFLEAGAGAAAFFAARRRAYAMFSNSPSLQKFPNGWKLPGLGPSGIPVAASDGTRNWPGTVATHYTIDMREFTQQLHPALGPTKLWGYGQLNNHRHLGGVIVAAKNQPVQLTFRNFLPATHILPVDTSDFFMDAQMHGANRASVHLHGGFTPWIADGEPSSWFAPAGGPSGSTYSNNLISITGAGPNSSTGAAEYYWTNQQSARLMWYHDHAMDITRLNAYAGLASGYVLRDDLENRLIQAGIIPGREVPLIFQDKIFQPNGSLFYAKTYDPATEPDGKGRWEQGPTLPGHDTLPVPSVVPEFFGDTILANGVAYPYTEVIPRRYRFRILNAFQARFMNLQLYYLPAGYVEPTLHDDGQGPPDGDHRDPNLVPTNPPGPKMIQIGTEGGFLDQPVVFDRNRPIGFDFTTGNANRYNLLLAPAERADVLIDFAGCPVGSRIVLYSDAPAPFPGGDPRNDYFYGQQDLTAIGGVASPAAGFGPNTRTLLEFHVVAAPAGTPPDMAEPLMLAALRIQLALNILKAPEFSSLPGGFGTRDLTLNEDFDAWGRLIQRLGTTQDTTNMFPDISLMAAKTYGRAYDSAPTEVVNKGAVEIWRIWNLTGDTHPIHFHLVNVRILRRQPFDGITPDPRQLARNPGAPPDANELGWKETVRINPSEVITVIMRFDLPTVPFQVPLSTRTGVQGHEYVWHCHILEHEEHDMMRPLVVRP